MCAAGSWRPLEQDYPPKLSNDVPCCPEGTTFNTAEEMCMDEKGNSYGFGDIGLGDSAGQNLLDYLPDDTDEDGKGREFPIWGVLGAGALAVVILQAMS